VASVVVVWVLLVVLGTRICWRPVHSYCEVITHGTCFTVRSLRFMVLTGNLCLCLSVSPCFCVSVSLCLCLCVFDIGACHSRIVSLGGHTAVYPNITSPQPMPPQPVSPFVRCKDVCVCVSVSASVSVCVCVCVCVALFLFVSVSASVFVVVSVSVSVSGVYGCLCLYVCVRVCLHGLSIWSSCGVQQSERRIIHQSLSIIV
jgi:hypothetical protein